MFGVNNRAKSTIIKRIIIRYLKVISLSGIRAPKIDRIKMTNNSMILDRLCAPKPTAVRASQNNDGKKMMLSFFVRLFMVEFLKCEMLL